MYVIIVNRKFDIVTWPMWDFSEPNDVFAGIHVHACLGEFDNNVARWLNYSINYSNTNRINSIRKN